MNYFLVIFVPTFLYMINDIFSLKTKVFRQMAIFFLIVITSLRYNFGVDYITYSQAFERMKVGVYTDNFEIGYLFLNKFVIFLGQNFNFVLLIIGIFNYIFLYLAIEKNVKRFKWLSIFLYLIYFDLFFYSLSAIRQSIVVGIFLFSLQYIVDKKFIKYLIYMLVGSLFHMTSLLLIPIYFLYHYLKDKNLIRLVIFSTLLLSIYLFFDKILYLIKPFLSKRYAYYLFIEKNEVPNNLFLGIVIYVVMILYIILIKHLQKKEDEVYLTVSAIGILIFFILKIMQNLNYYGIIPRFQMYFYCLYILYIPELFEKLKSRLNHIYIYMIFVMMIFGFIVKYMEVNEYAGEYYKTFKLIINN